MSACEGFFFVGDGSGAEWNLFLAFVSANFEDAAGASDSVRFRTRSVDIYGYLHSFADIYMKYVAFVDKST